MRVLNFHVKERNLLMLKLLFLKKKLSVQNDSEADTNEFKLYRCDYCGQHLENIRSAPSSASFLLDLSISEHCGSTITTSSFLNEKLPNFFLWSCFKVVGIFDDAFPMWITTV